VGLAALHAAGAHAQPVDVDAVLLLDQPRVDRLPAGVGGAPGPAGSAADSGRRSALVTANSVSSVGLRCPVSSSDSVPLPRPARRASSDSERPRSVRSDRSRRPTSAATRALLVGVLATPLPYVL
jgi:hypothetical protein